MAMNIDKKTAVAAVIIILAIVIGVYSFLNFQKGSVAGLKVVSNPPASVFLNDELLGKTPYEDKLSSGEYILKLIPEESATGVSSWQGKVTLNPSVLTFVNRDLDKSELTSAGEIVFMEKINENEAQIAVFSTPDVVDVLLDGQKKGQTPILLRDVTDGDHDIAASSPGFLSRTVRIQTIPGFKVIVNFSLALDETSKLTEEGRDEKGEEREKEEKPYVLIKDTPTDFLRVREGPSTATKELSKVKPGEKYPFFEEKDGWFKIEYEDEKEGWVSGRYAEKIQ